MENSQKKNIIISREDIQYLRRMRKNMQQGP